jgi:uncharacterized MAPEG superfamily protein
MHAPTWPALITLACVLLQLWTSMLVARARGRYGVKAPATTGHADFERAFRVQMNTIEASLMFLPALWVAAVYGTPSLVAGAGVAWLIGRVLYGLGYLREASKRSAGFLVGALALGVLLVDGAVGLARALLA